MYNRLVAAGIDRAFDAVRKKFPDAFIGGGAARDFICNKEVNDLDFFTWQPIPQEAQLKERVELYPENDRLVCVSKPFQVDGVPYPVRMIQLNPSVVTRGDVEQCVKLFALGMQQAYIPEWKGRETEVLSTREFWYDYHDKLMTVTRCEFFWEAKHIIEKAANLQVKYPWPLVIPPKFMHHFTVMTEEYTNLVQQKRESQS